MLLPARPTEVVQEVHLEKGDQIFHAGEPALSFYIVKSGRVDLIDDNGLVKSLTAGEHFGERALLQDKIWRFSAVAAEPGTLVSLNAKTFETLVRGSSSIQQLLERSANQYLTRQEIDSLIAAVPEAVKSKFAGEMMSRNVVSMHPEMTVAQAMRLMVEHPYNSFPLVTGDGKLLGMIVQNEIYEGLKLGKITNESLLGEMTAAQYPTILQTTSVPDALERFYRSGRHKLLVTDADNHLCGILTPMDLLTPKV